MSAHGCTGTRIKSGTGFTRMPRLQQELNPHTCLVEEVAGTGQVHSHASSLSSLDNFLVAGPNRPECTTARNVAAPAGRQRRGRTRRMRQPHRGHARYTSPPRVFARSTESLQESTRFTWPIPIPTAAPLSASRIALDLGERSARQANSRSRRVASSAASPATRVQFFGSSPSACRRSASWKSAPPEMGRYSMASRARFWANQQARVLLLAQNLQRLGLEAGSHRNHLGEDTLDGLSHSGGHRAVSGNHATVCGQRVASVRLRVSIRNRVSRARGIATAIPQGLLCLIAATAGSSKS